MSTATQQTTSTYAAKCRYRNSQIGRISLCHTSNQTVQPEGFLSSQEDKITGMKLPLIQVEEGEEGELFVAKEQEIIYDCSRLSPANTLDAAVAQNNSELLKRILTSTATVTLDGLNASGGSPIHEAAFQGKLSCLKVFLKFGADPNMRDKEGWTPLHAAICGGDPDSVAELLRFGANVNLAANDGVKPIEMAIQCGDERVIKLLSSNKPRLDNNFKEKDGTAPLAGEENFSSNILDYI
ncbi:ankyrin repeat, PH and SEC7 domain containing protein secG [Nematostella vectensis]|nr:ankyrin repeat, PH and SEC7 domain containing protein secG [Nematostella vectensis]